MMTTILLIYGMRQQVKDLRRTLSVHDSVQEVAP
jgi:hypothetical protein